MSVVESMSPVSARNRWLSDSEPHARFLDAYRTLWPKRDPALDASRTMTRNLELAISEGLREGGEELIAQEPGREYAHPGLASLYEELHPTSPREDYYVKAIMSARAILDLGCGTGRLLKRAAQAQDMRNLGYVSRTLVGVDRESAMLAVARSEDMDISWAENLIDWTEGDARTVDVHRRFDLVTMTGGAFQELLTDDDIRMVLSNVRRHLDPGGRFAFDAPVRDHESADDMIGWERRITSAGGDRIEVVQVPKHIAPDLVDLTTTYTFAESVGGPLVSRTRVRMIDPDHLRALLEEVGFRIDVWFGAWERTSLLEKVPKDVVIAVPSA